MFFISWQGEYKEKIIKRNSFPIWAAPKKNLEYTAENSNFSSNQILIILLRLTIYIHQEKCGKHNINNTIQISKAKFG